MTTEWLKGQLTAIFAQALDDMRGHYPESLNSVVLIDVDAPEAAETIRALGMPGITRKGKPPKEEDIKKLEKVVESVMSHLACYHPGIHAVAYKPSHKNGWRTMFSYNPFKNAYMIALHEIGHAVTMPQMELDDSEINSRALRNTIRKEVAADIFALLHGLKAGVIDLEDIKLLSLVRSLDALACQNADHSTSFAVNSLIRWASCKDLRNLTHQEILQHALSSAEDVFRFDMERTVSSDAMIFRSECAALTDTLKVCHTQPLYSLQFYDAANIFNGVAAQNSFFKKYDKPDFSKQKIWGRISNTSLRDDFYHLNPAHKKQNFLQRIFS